MSPCGEKPESGIGSGSSAALVGSKKVAPGNVVWRSVWVMVPAAALEHLRRPRGGGRDRDAGHGVVAPRARLGGASEVELRLGVHSRAVVEARGVGEVGRRGRGIQL